MIQLCIPVCFQRIDFLSDLSGRIGVGVYNGFRFRRGLHTEKEEYGSGLAGSQSDCAGESAAGVLIVAGHISQISGDHALRIAVSVIFPEKSILIPAVGGDFCTRKSEEAFGYFFIVYFFILPQCIEVAVDLLDDPVLLK